MFLRLSQTKNAALSAEVFQSYSAFISGIETANSPEYLGVLINKACNDNLVVLSIETRGTLQTQLAQSLTSILSQHTKHLSYLTLAYLALPMLDPKTIFDTTRCSLPTRLIDITSQPLVAIGEYHRLTNPEQVCLQAH